MRRLGLSDSDTCSSTLTGTPGITTDTEPRRRRERETNLTTQVARAVEDLQSASQTWLTESFTAIYLLY